MNNKKRYIHGDIPIIAVDFDGVIVDFAFPGIGQIKKGAKEVLKLLKKKGCKIIIFSGRTDITFPENQDNKRYDEMLKFLIKNDIPFDDIWTGRGKLIADVYIDDKAIHFTNWIDTLKEIKRRGII